MMDVPAAFVGQDSPDNEGCGSPAPRTEVSADESNIRKGVRRDAR